MGLYRAAQAIGAALTVTHVQPQPMKVLRAAGVDRILTFREEVHI